MKKQLLSIALGLVAMFTVSTGFAAGVKKADATVKTDGDKTSVFNQKGKLVYTIEKFTPDALPKDIMDIVVKNYGQYYISGMEKVSQPGITPVYFVHMQNNESLKVVKVNADDNETELVEDYTKG